MQVAFREGEPDKKGNAEFLDQVRRKHPLPSHEVHKRRLVHHF